MRSLLSACAMLALALPVAVSAAGAAAGDALPSFVGAFLSNSSREWLLSSFTGMPLCPLVQSDAVHRADNFPITSGFLASPGSGSPLQVTQSQAVQLMGFVRDLHVQSVLLAAMYPSPILTSTHVYPQVTLAHSAEAALWSEVEINSYSESLWARLENGGLITVERDRLNKDYAGRVKAVKIPEAAPGRIGADGLSLITTLQPSLFAQETEVYVQVIDAAEPVTWMDAYVCSAANWNSTTAICTVPLLETPQDLFGFFPQLARDTMIENVVEATCLVGWDVRDFARAMVIDDSSTAPLEASLLNQQQQYGMWAFARDEHASAVLLALLHTPQDPSPLYTQQPYCQATLTAMDNHGEGDYDPTYGQVLWERLEAAQLLTVHRDAAGHIIGAEMGPAAGVAPGTPEVNATLPAYTSPRTGRSYRASNAWMLMLNGTLADGHPLNGSLCDTQHWDAESFTCAGAPAKKDDGHSAAWKIAVGAGVGGGLLLTCTLLGLCVWCKRRSQRGSFPEGGTLDDQLGGEAHYRQLNR